MNDRPVLAYEKQGEGPIVILLHGLAASRQDWRWLSPLLVSAGFCAYSIDLIGHGDSPKPSDPALYNIRTQYALLEDFLDSQLADRQFFLVGHSLGGHLCMLLALHRACQVHGLVLVDPFLALNQLNPVLRLFNHWPASNARALELTPGWLVNSAIGILPFAPSRGKPEVRQHIADNFNRASPNIMYLSGAVQDLMKDAGQIKTPTLLIWGENDLTLNPDSFSKLLKRFPNATGRSLTHCGHQPHLDHRDQVNPWVLKFLSVQLNHLQTKEKLDP